MKFEKPFLVKITKEESEYISESLDSIFRGVSNKMKTNFKHTIKTNTLSLIDVKNGLLVCAYHSYLDSIYFNYGYFKSMTDAGYFKIKEDIDGVSCYVETKLGLELMWNTPYSKFVLEESLNGSIFFSNKIFNSEEINIDWVCFSDLQSRKMKIENFLKFLEEDVAN